MSNKVKKVTGDKVIFQFSPDMDPVLEIEPGEEVLVEANDCFYQQLFEDAKTIGDLDFGRVNPATGPIYVKGAEPGDMIKVTIKEIRLKDKGIAATLEGAGLLGDQVTESVIRVIDIKEDHADFNGIKIPLAPMVGVIGVAPADADGSWPNSTPWRHGGNMDTSDIKPGSSVYFPVNQPGALLALGDCHAAMADGEMSFTGLEAQADVLIQVDLIKNKTCNWPLIETADYTAVNASGDNLDDATYKAADQAIDHICKALDIQWEDAYILGTLAVDLKISQVVDPKITVRACIPKHILSTEDLINKSC